MSYVGSKFKVQSQLPRGRRLKILPVFAPGNTSRSHGRFSQKTYATAAIADSACGRAPGTLQVTEVPRDGVLCIVSWPPMRLAR